MRLEPIEIEAIRQAVREVFGAAAAARVFGSRVHAQSVRTDAILRERGTPPSEIAEIAREQGVIL